MLAVVAVPAYRVHNVIHRPPRSGSLLGITET